MQVDWTIVAGVFGWIIAAATFFFKADAHKRSVLSETARIEAWRTETKTQLDRLSKDHTEVWSKLDQLTKSVNALCSDVAVIKTKLEYMNEKIEKLEGNK